MTDLDLARLEVLRRVLLVCLVWAGVELVGAWRRRQARGRS